MSLWEFAVGDGTVEPVFTQQPMAGGLTLIAYATRPPSDCHELP